MTKESSVFRYVNMVKDQQGDIDKLKNAQHISKAGFRSLDNTWLPVYDEHKQVRMAIGRMPATEDFGVAYWDESGRTMLSKPENEHFQIEHLVDNPATGFAHPYIDATRRSIEFTDYGLDIRTQSNVKYLSDSPTGEYPPFPGAALTMFDTGDIFINAGGEIAFNGPLKTNVFGYNWNFLPGRADFNPADGTCEAWFPSQAGLGDNGYRVDYPWLDDGHKQNAMVKLPPYAPSGLGGVSPVITIGCVDPLIGLSDHLAAADLRVFLLWADHTGFAFKWLPNDPTIRVTVSWLVTRFRRDESLSFGGIPSVWIAPITEMAMEATLTATASA